MRCSPRLLVCFVTLIAVGSLAPPAIAYKYGWSVRAAGPTQKTFDSSETCNPNGDWIDEPVRVFRYRNTETPSKLKVQGTWARHPQSKRMIGDDLYSLKRESTLADAEHPEYRDCGADPVYRGDAPGNLPTEPYPGSYPPIGDNGPGTYQNSEWLESPYIKDGKVYALIHNEFHAGNVDPAFDPPWCDPSTFPPPPASQENASNCWMTAVTMAVSDPANLPEPVCPGADCWVSSPFDKIGSWYVQPSDYLVGAIPYRYEQNWGRHGYGALTNIIKGERQENGQDAYYFLVNVTAPDPLPQKPGICLMRTTNLASASAWRAWDGDGFDATVNSNPYSADPPPSQAGHICEPVFSGMQVRNITYNRELEKYMVVGTHADPNARSAKYALSDDLINWSPAQVIFEEEDLNSATGCPDPRAGYPALLDPDDPAQITDPDTAGANTNFDHPDRFTDVFHRRPVQGPPPACSPDGPGPGGEGSDLVHTPLELKQRLTTVSGSSLEAQPSGYDKVQGSYVYHMPGEDYDADSSDKYMHAMTWGGQATFGYGRLGAAVGTPLEWNDGDDVWYASAFYLPPTFLAENTAPHLMRWETATGQYGGIQLRPSDKLQLIRTPSNTPVISTEFTPPVGRWFWIEVHQKLGTSSANGTLNEVYIDGKLVGTSTDANRADSAPVKRVNYGFVTNNLPNGSVSSIEVDRSSILGAQRGAVIGNGSFQAARTPIGVRASAPGSGQIRLDWNGPAAGDPSVNGYRIYELQVDGTWDPVNVDQTGAGVFNITKSGLTPCSVHTYRITAHRSFTDSVPTNPTTTESVPTSPVTQAAGGPC